MIEYYEREIRYFFEEAGRFAEAHPEQARALGMENLRDRDPYAERLIEAFAFLAGTVNERIDNDYLDLARELLNVIWPQYLYPLPASAIIECDPDPSVDLRGGLVLGPGAVIESSALSTGLTCSFTTTGTVCMRPFSAGGVKMVSRRDGRTALRLELAPEPREVDWNELDRRPFSFYLHGDPGFAFSLYYLLLTDIVEVIVSWKEDGAKRKRALRPDILKPLVSDVAAESPLLHYPEYAFPGFRLLEEYFFFPDKFRFFQLDILSAIAGPDPDSKIEVDFILSGQEDWRLEPGDANLKLNCTPAINLFPASAEPFFYDDSRRHHRLVVNQSNPEHVFPHHVNSVESLNIEGTIHRKYHDFFSYRHEMEGTGDGYYHVKRRMSADRRPELLLSLTRFHDDKEETISVDVLASNDLVVREVRVNDIQKATAGIPDFVAVRNITAPCAPVWPDLKGREIWSLISSMSLNYMPLDNQDQIKEMLILYDRGRSRSNLRRIAGIDSVETRPISSLFKGCPIRGIQMDIVLREDHFTNRGDLLLFADVLSRVMAMYVSINSFCELRVTEKNSGRVHKRTIKGEQTVL